MNETAIDYEPIKTNGINRMKQTRYGLMLYNPNDLYIGKALDLYGEYSNGEVDLFRQLIAPGSIVLDIGANIGPHTLAFTQIVGSSGTVLAFEPQRILFQILCANMALNGIVNSFCYNTAVGNSAGTITVPFLDYSIENNFGGLSLSKDETRPGEQTGILMVDSLNIPQCNFVKIDVEGMELDVLVGAFDTIKRCRPFIYVENDRKENSEALIENLLSMNYNLYWHCPMIFNPDNYFRCDTNIFDCIGSINMLCIPSELPPFEAKTLQPVKHKDDWFLKKLQPMGKHMLKDTV